MTILSCTAFSYELPLVAPLQLGKQQLFSRRGFIIRISDDDRHFGYGEVAPLPGLHRENIEAVLQQFRQIQPKLIGSELPNELQHLWDVLESWLAGYQLYPSLRHGLEMAVFNFLACIKGKTLAGLLNPAYQKMLPVNGLLTGSAVDIQEQVRRLLAEGYTTIKLKVGRQSLEKDIALVRAVRQALDRDVTLRLDANRLWDFATAVHFGQAVADCTVEYIEEPLTDPRRSTDFYQLT
jgi:O-succinylbenzoate synthase